MSISVFSDEKIQMRRDAYQILFVYDYLSLTPDKIRAYLNIYYDERKARKIFPELYQADCDSLLKVIQIIRAKIPPVTPVTDVISSWYDVFAQLYRTCLGLETVDTTLLMQFERIQGFYAEIFGDTSYEYYIKYIKSQPERILFMVIVAFANLGSDNLAAYTPLYTEAFMAPSTDTLDKPSLATLEEKFRHSLKETEEYINSRYKIYSSAYLESLSDEDKEQLDAAIEELASESITVDRIQFKLSPASYAISLKHHIDDLSLRQKIDDIVNKLPETLKQGVAPICVEDIPTRLQGLMAEPQAYIKEFIDNFRVLKTLYGKNDIPDISSISDYPSLSLSLGDDEFAKAVRKAYAELIQNLEQNLEEINTFKFTGMDEEKAKIEEFKAASQAYFKYAMGFLCLAVGASSPIEFLIHDYPEWTTIPAVIVLIALIGVIYNVSCYVDSKQQANIAENKLDNISRNAAAFVK